MVACLVFGAAIVALFVVAEVEGLVGLNELAAARFGAVDRSGCDSLRPLLTQLAVCLSVAALSGVGA